MTPRTYKMTEQPASNLCQHCRRESATLDWGGTHDSMSLARNPRLIQRWCQRCVLTAQVAHWRLLVPKLAEAERALAALEAADGTGERCIAQLSQTSTTTPYGHVYGDEAPCPQCPPEPAITQSSAPPTIPNVPVPPAHQRAADRAKALFTPVPPTACELLADPDYEAPASQSSPSVEQARKAVRDAIDDYIEGGFSVGIIETNLDALIAAVRADRDDALQATIDRLTTINQRLEAEAAVRAERAQGEP